MDFSCPIAYPPYIWCINSIFGVMWCHYTLHSCVTVYDKCLSNFIRQMYTRFLNFWSVISSRVVKEEFLPGMKSLQLDLKELVLEGAAVVQSMINDMESKFGDENSR